MSSDEKKQAEAWFFGVFFLQELERLAQVVRKADNDIHRINRYPVFC